MDTVGIVLLGVGLVLYLIAYKDRATLAKFALFVAGTGFGIIIGAVWSYFILGSVFSY